MIQTSDKDLKSKLQMYLSASIIRWAGAEGACLLSVIAVYLSGNLTYFCITAVYFLYMITLNPTPKKISKELNLSYDEKHELGIKE